MIVRRCAGGNSTPLRLLAAYHTTYDVMASQILFRLIEPFAGDRVRLVPSAHHLHGSCSIRFATLAHGRGSKQCAGPWSRAGALCIAVSMIPEGLPALITITLAIGVQRMAARNAIVRRLPAVETLGSVARICSDKTGTLELFMEMMVVSAATASETLKVTGDGYANEGQVLKDGAPVGKDPVLELLGRVSALCNDAELRQEEGVWKVEGDPTEGALYPFAAKLGMDRAERAGRLSAHDAIPFESEHRFMATLHTTPEGGEILLVKGAPEAILDHCNRQQDAGGAKPLDRAYFEKASDVLAGQGERVLALAWLPDPGVKAGNLSRPICRRPSCCSASSGFSIRRARRRSRRSRNAMPGASA